MSTTSQRYIFTDFENIQKVKFKKLERVCDKVFILINVSDQFIPFTLVRNLQKLGKAVKWIAVENNKNLTLNYHICYMMGKMHNKIRKPIEFAILSDDDVFDSIVTYINSNGRKCMRVKTDADKKAIPQPVPKSELPEHSKEEGEQPELGDDPSPPKPFFVDEPKGVSLTEYTIHETKERLKLIKNRPYTLHSLEDYIHINNQELVERGKLDVKEIIELMEIQNEIDVEEGVVAYNF